MLLNNRTTYINDFRKYIQDFATPATGSSPGFWYDQKTYNWWFTSFDDGSCALHKYAVVRKKMHPDPVDSLLGTKEEILAAIDEITEEKPDNDTIDKNKINELIATVSGKLNKLECDGATRVLSHLLTRNEIPHAVMVGSASMGKIRIPVHYWIVIDDKILDLKAKMWFGDKATEGIFTDSPVQYNGRAIEMKTTETVFNILTR